MPPGRLRPAPHAGARPLQVVPAADYRICRGQDRQSRAGTLRRLRREQRRVERVGLQCGALMSERNGLLRL
jgi:hypothetical protein